MPHLGLEPDLEAEGHRVPRAEVNSRPPTRQEGELPIGTAKQAQTQSHEEVMGVSSGERIPGQSAVNRKPESIAGASGYVAANEEAPNVHTGTNPPPAAASGLEMQPQASAFGTPVE